MSNLETERLQIDIKRLKGIYKDYGEGREYDELNEDERKEKSGLYQSLLENEYELQETKKRIAGVTYKEPKKGDWVIIKSKLGYKRVKLAGNSNCGW
jgi:single-stranded DNA-specific DHH superfamily exonuclease